MSKKKIRNVDAWDALPQEADATTDSSMGTFDEKLFGAIGVADTHRLKASPISIFEIFPDPAQPRRSVPHKVRQAIGWHGDVTRMAELFGMWEELVNEERGANTFKLSDYLDQKEIGEDDEADRPDDEALRPIERALINLIALATSIRNEGLTNPITVVKQGNVKYQLETGERRWLSFHLLHLHTQEEQYAKVAAREVDSLNIWRQAAENNARADLNAISKARQFSVLLMNLLHTEKQEIFTPFHEFQNHELGFYAQVADGESYRIPRGKAELLLNATGLKNKKQLREYRRLLRLPPSVWDMADDLNWTERFIRDLMTEARDDEVRLIEIASYEAAKQGYSVPVGTVTAKHTTTVSKPRKPINLVDEKPAPGTKQYYNLFTKLVRSAKTGKPEAREKALDMIDDFRRWLDEEEFQLSQKD